MYKRSRRIERRKKLFAALVAAFILCNIILVTPAFASANGQQTPSGAHSCWPFWPFCTPSPTATPSNAPTPTHTGTPVPGTPGPQPTGTPGGSPTPTPIGSPIHLAASSSFTMTATQIVGTDAHLSLLPDPSHPVLTFASMTVQGLKITHFSFTLTANSASGSGVSIKTSVFQEFLSGLSSFTNKADLLILLAGGTVHTLTMTNVSLQIDRSVDAQSFTANGLHLVY